MKDKKGRVFLIGAGPGDPGLLTVKAKECIEKADVVVYDYLASPFILRYAKKDAQIIYVGKKAGDHTLAQDKINSLLAEKAGKGLKVARLKGGDPFVFGRGGEEAEILAENGIEYEIIPGVTSAVAAPAYAGIPVTHRKHASSVSFITGHEDPAKKDTSMQWDVFAGSNATLVFLMGVKNLENIVQNLIEHGKAPDTPAAVVRWGTTPKQKTVSGSLENIVRKTKQAGLKAPAVIVVGHVASLRDKLRWFDRKPLFGKKIIVTRAKAQASTLVSRLSDLGARCIEIPTIQVRKPENTDEIKKSVENIRNYDWLVFTSVNGVKFFFEILFATGRDVRALGHLKFACIGPATKEKLADLGIISDILPETYRAESVAEAFLSADVKGKKILLPRAKKARSILPEKLAEMGASVHEVTVYETDLNKDGKEKLIGMLESDRIDAVTFTSSSTVSNFVSLIKSRISLLKNTVCACIGPVTADTARSLGIEPDIEAEIYTIPGLVDSLIKYYKGIK